MNTIIFGDKKLKYESYWRALEDDDTLDSKNNKFPWPEVGQPWQNQNNFIKQLGYTQSELDKENNFDEYDIKTKCHICGKNINSKLYKLDSVRWENGLIHYIEEHNVKPSDKFIELIFKFEINTQYLPPNIPVSRIQGRQIRRNKLRYLKIDRNQIFIMDSLMEHGGKKIYVTNKKNFFRYSEHVGLLDFNKSNLEKLIIYANTARVDEYDEDIYLPGDIPDAFDYEYIFHTHPPTPKPGGRANMGILYEFPSIGDIIYFIDHYNEGNTQGSIIVAAEGMYIIRKLNNDLRTIEINENEMVRKINLKYSKLQSKYIRLYGTKFNDNKFYSTIAQNIKPVHSINKILNQYSMHIDFYPRIKDSLGNWIIDTVYVPVYPIETR